MRMDPWQYKPARDLGMPMGRRLLSSKRESGLIGRLTNRVGGQAFAALLRCFEKLSVEGRQHLPKEPPFVLISNHASHFDSLVLARVLPASLRSKVFPIAAGDTFFQTRAHATLSAGLINALPMWRKNCGRHGLEELRARLVEEPCGFILFPEGTRSRTGQMSRFKAGIGMIVAATPVPVIPCYLRGTYNAWPPNSRWPKRGARIAVRIGTPVQFESVMNDREGWQQIAGDLERAVGSLDA
jgi:1-acyl-sn-glycerol-3-phosphate acyltransferase